MVPVIAIVLSFLMVQASETADEDIIYYTESGKAEFHSSVPLDEFTGTTEHLTGMIDLHNNEIDFFVDLETLDTGNDRRDRDMYRTLNVEEFPFAEFTGSLSSGFDENDTSTQEVEATGEFTVHGVTRDLAVKGTLQKLEDSLILQAEWVLDITDFDIEPPGILFYRVADEMDVKIEATLRPKSRDEI